MSGLKDTLDNDQLSSFLYQKYIIELLSTRKIANLLYGNSKSFSCVNKLLKKFNIPIRHGSEAIKTQWINNDNRRKEASELAKINLNSPEAKLKSRLKLNSESHRKMLSDRMKGDKNPMYGVCGEQHPQWNPDRTHEQRVTERKTSQDKIWRKSVFERDNYICKCCNYSKGGVLVAHHINSYNSYELERYDVNNGITLCEDCHKKFHHIYGYGNNTRSQFEEFMKNNFKE